MLARSKSFEFCAKIFLILISNIYLYYYWSNVCRMYHNKSKTVSLFPGAIFCVQEFDKGTNSNLYLCMCQK